MLIKEKKVESQLKLEKVGKELKTKNKNNESSKYKRVTSMIGINPTI